MSLEFVGRVEWKTYTGFLYGGNISKKPEFDKGYLKSPEGCKTSGALACLS
jgi:hypothetical protein